MAITFRQARELAIAVFCTNLIDEDTFAMIYSINYSNNLNVPYESYDIFDIDNLCDDECLNELRFYKNDIYKLQEVLKIPEEIVCHNRVKIDGIEALYMFLKRFSYPRRYSEMIPRFARPVPQICMSTNLIMSHIFGNFEYLFKDFNQAWLAPAQLSIFSHAITNKGAQLLNFWGFIDGTVSPFWRSQESQRLIYNGHKSYV